MPVAAATCSIRACAPETLKARRPYWAVPLLPSRKSRDIVKWLPMVMLTTDSIAGAAGSGWLPPSGPLALMTAVRIQLPVLWLECSMQG